MFTSRKSSKPGSADFVSRQLTMSGHSCSHFPKLKAGIQTGIPSRLGFFPAYFNSKPTAKAECNSVSVLLTERLCRECYDAVVPQGFDVWCIAQHGPCPAVKTLNNNGQDLRFPVLIEAGTEPFSDYGRVLQVIFNRPHFPDHTDAAAAWGWMQKRRRPFYVDALHATSRRDPSLGRRVNTDAMVATRHGTIFNAANTHKAAQSSIAESAKSSSSRWSLGQKFSPGNFRASMSSVSLASGMRRSKNRLDDDAASTITNNRISVDARTVRFDEKLTAGGNNYVPPMPPMPPTIPHLHRRPMNNRMHSQPHPSVFLPPTYRPGPYRSAPSRPATYIPRSHSDVSWGGYASLDERLALMRGPSLAPSVGTSTRSSSNEVNVMASPPRPKHDRTESHLSKDGSESSTSTDYGKPLELPLKSPRRVSVRLAKVELDNTPGSISPGEITDVSYTDSGNSTPLIEPMLVEYSATTEKLPMIVVSGAKADTPPPVHEIAAHLVPATILEEPKDFAVIWSQTMPGAFID